MALPAHEDQDMAELFPDRRTALATVAAFPAVMLPEVALSSESASMVSAFSLYGMKDVPLGKALDHLARIGYRAVELACLPGWEMDPTSMAPQAIDQLRKELSTRGLSVAALMLDAPLDTSEANFKSNLAMLAKACALSRSLDAAAPPVLETILGGKAGDLPAKLPLHRERLARVVELLEREGNTLALKPHRMQAFDDATALAALVSGARSRRVAVAFDPSHFQHRMPGIAEAWRTLAPNIRFVHIKETVVDGKQVRFVLPGEGGLDLNMVRGLLSQSGYKGPVCVEVSRQVWSAPGYDPLAAAAKSFPVIRKIAHG